MWMLARQDAGGLNMQIADIPEENKGGECYRCAAQYVMEHPETHSLAHAVVTGQGPIEGLRYGHAFVLFDRDGVEYVKDLNADVEMPSALYFAVGRIDPEKVVTYSPREAAVAASTSGHWGPWDETIDAAFHSGIGDE